MPLHVVAADMLCYDMLYYMLYYIAFPLPHFTGFTGANVQILTYKSTNTAVLRHALLHSVPAPSLYWLYWYKSMLQPHALVHSFPALSP